MTIKVTYLKHFLTGTLAGLELECSCEFPDAAGAARFALNLGAGVNWDAGTRDEFTARNFAFSPVVAYDPDTDPRFAADDGGKCPDCEMPSSDGHLCDACIRERETAGGWSDSARYDAADSAYDMEVESSL